MRQIFIFDVEGTLTPQHGGMDAGFARFFPGFVAQHPVYLVSSRGFASIEQQIPQPVFEACAGVFANNGAELAAGGAIVYSKHHEFHPMVRIACETFVDTSWFPLRLGGHIDETPGMLRVSSLGRNASMAERRRYCAWDANAGERRQFIEAIDTSGLGYRAALCGEIGVRISPAGWDKGVVRNEVLRRHPSSALHYHGANIAAGGCGQSLAAALRGAGDIHTVSPAASYTQTWSSLVRYQKSLTRGAKGLSAA
jgi:phosphomannomutase